ncbi:antifungal protein ginkbilobin-like protein [Neltuma alba]|uniref:antifungal protein ginkbilobin-like protein n=1 Tax=Neltuma alba TaxID=207710 RepID=UPI0010A58E35|nr:antifungal protein ginkbilobin-like protein [Prosopis alba]
MKKYASIMTAMICLRITAECFLDATIINVLCNEAVFTSGDPFAISLHYVLQQLETVTSTRRNYDYSNISPYPNAFAYGHAACTTNLTTSDCNYCLAAAKRALFATCQSRIGPCSLLSDCTLGYEQYPFDD